MSEPESVLVAVGAGPKPRIPKQNYENIVTKYNMAPAGPDPAFFNLTINKIDPSAPPHICGFMRGNHFYSFPGAIQEIVDVFNSDEGIEIVTADTVVKKTQNGAEYVYYGHSEVIMDIPFFVRGSIAKSIEFKEHAEIFKEVLQSLVSNGRKIYHIGESLLTVEVHE